MDERILNKIVEAVLEQINLADEKAGVEPVKESISTENIADITSKKVKAIPLLDNAQDEEALIRMMGKTSARIGVGRSGTRPKTQTMLALRADHAAAQDAVFADVDEKILEELNLKSYQTCCEDKNVHLTRPDLGRLFSSETISEIKKNCTANPDVQIFVSDGLSSAAVTANARDILPMLTDALGALGLSVGTPFFVKYGRVAAMDHVAQALGAKVTCVLIGERPGLGNAQSMSAYIAYDAKVGMPEANRTVVSNIHSEGITSVEAGAYIAEIIDKIFKNKASGVNLKK